MTNSLRTFHETEKNLPVKSYDVVIAGGGTAGAVAAIAAARSGSRTALVESKGYPGGVAVEGGTALHSFYNLWKAFPGVDKKQVVKGIPQEIIDRLAAIGGTSGHAEQTIGFDYDSVCIAIDTELYKLVLFELLDEAGVDVLVNTLLVGANVHDNKITGCIVESRSGREYLAASSFIDCTGYGDLAAFAGADFSEPNDHPVANSIGIGNVDIDQYYEFLSKYSAVTEYSEGKRSGIEGRLIRISGNLDKMPTEFEKGARSIGMAAVTTTIHDNYFMFIKLNYKMAQSPTSRDAVAKAELELRRRQYAAVKLFRDYVPGCEKAFIARTSPSLCIRRGRCIKCDYDISIDEVLDGIHFADDILTYGFHDLAPKMQIKNGGTYGLPYRALCVTGIDNLYAAGMNITSDFAAHMSTRNTVSCMAMGQAAGTAAALCSGQGFITRDLPYSILKKALVESGVYLEN